LAASRELISRIIFSWTESLPRMDFFCATHFSRACARSSFRVVPHRPWIHCRAARSVFFLAAGAQSWISVSSSQCLVGSVSPVDFCCCLLLRCVFRSGSCSCADPYCCCNLSRDSPSISFGLCFGLLQGEIGIALESPDQKKLEDSLFKLLFHDDFLNTPTRCSIKCM
jgi:hypothetical protein